MPPNEPNEEENLEKLPEDYDTPFGPAPTRQVSGLSTYPATDTDIDQSEMDTVFNLGIGFVMIVSRYYAESIQRQLEEGRIKTRVIGEVIPGEPGVEWKT